MLGEMKVFGDHLPEEKRTWDFPKEDFRIFSDPEVHEKYKKYFTHHDTVMNFYLTPEIPYQHMKTDIFNKYDNYVNSKLEENPDQIFVFFSHNNGYKGVCFTPWILIHRAFHAYDSNFTDGKDLEWKKKIMEVFHNFYNDLVYEIKPKLAKDHIKCTDGAVIVMSHWDFDNEIRDIIYSFINTRCFRNNNVSGDFEIITECWTQFYYTGSVKLLRFEQSKFSHYERIDVEKINNIIADLENKANDLFKEFLEMNKGRTWVF